MAEVEYGGLKVGGSKLLLIIPLLSMLGGGAWAGFELYNEFRVLKATVLKYQPPDITGIEQEIAVFSYIIKRIIIPYDDFSFTTKFEFEYKKINQINNMKEYYEVINNPNLSFNIKPSKNWFFKILLCVCLIFRDKLNMNYSSYHTDLIFSFIYF